jgi:hypothetical protein
LSQVPFVQAPPPQQTSAWVQANPADTVQQIESTHAATPTSQQSLALPQAAPFGVQVALLPPDELLDPALELFEADDALELPAVDSLMPVLALLLLAADSLILLLLLEPPLGATWPQGLGLLSEQYGAPLLSMQQK